jgi:beta-lactam-binding protein with PASTA domain
VTGWLGRIPALVGLVAGAVLAAAFEPKIVALLQRTTGQRPDDWTPPPQPPPGRRRRGRRWLVALATAIVSVVVIVSVIDVARGRSLVGDRDRTFLPSPSEPVKVVRVTVPAVANLQFDRAEALLEDAGLTVDRHDEFNANVDPELVIRTDPVAATRLRKGSAVEVFVSGNDAIVPDVDGLTSDEAADQVQGAGLTSEPQDEFNPDALVGTVIRTDPLEGTRVEEGSSVRLFVAAAGTTVPDVGGLRLSDARNEVEAAGLVPGSATRAIDPRVPVGQVIKTVPEAGTKVAEKTAVTFFVSSPPRPPPITSPTPNAPP